MKETIKERKAFKDVGGHHLQNYAISFDPRPKKTTSREDLESCQEAGGEILHVCIGISEKKGGRDGGNARVLLRTNFRTVINDLEGHILSVLDGSARTKISSMLLETAHYSNGIARDSTFRPSARHVPRTRRMTGVTKH
ncbi:hypothetical protein N7466_002969 [Penicillium verhagenii]|uniref:uncharacterized protein n=1 Tax=Penicillium verhagenii TaxID=1562060 RepID=UPI0025451052|nr:uncharacterized protein N7466_002969 [Penicillium verhagenii]KAJ5936519.1 hypothetical protein N7466_002969 [Penicillium verhagenii]